MDEYLKINAWGVGVSGVTTATSGSRDFKRPARLEKRIQAPRNDSVEHLQGGRFASLAALCL